MPKPAMAARRALALSCGFAALTTAMAFAAPAAAQNQDVTVEAVVITAQKREENLQDVPLSVAAESGEDLRAVTAGGADILALAARVPALYAESSNGRVAPRFYIRGLGNADFDLAASQPVSVIIDDVVMENVVLKSTPLFDIDRMEVARGPQGSLFGRNTTAGIVKFDSAKPTEDFRARADLSYATYGSYNFDGGIGGALIDGKLSARAALLVQHRDDWIDNGFTGKQDVMGGYDELAARLQLLFTPTEDLSILANIHGRSLEGTSALFRANIVGPGNNSINGNFDRGSVRYDGGGDNPQEYDGWGSSVKVDWDFGAATLTSITAYETTNGFSRGDIDGGNMVDGPGLILFPSDTTDGIEDHDQWTQELRIASNGDGPFAWQAGFFYFDSKLILKTDPGFVPPTTLQHDNTAWAVFGQGSYDVTEQLKITAGVRYTSDEKDMHVISGPNMVAPVSVSDEKVSWDLSAFYSLTPDVSVFARVASGFRGPTIQARDVAFISPASTGDSETILSWEAGFKSELFGRRVRLNGAVYTYSVEDMQFTAVGGGGNFNRLINADKGEAWGFEFDGEWIVNEYLSFTAGYSYTDTQIKDSDLAVQVCAQCTVTDPLVIPSPNPPNNYAYIDGNPFPNAPESILDFTARFQYPIDGTWEMFAFTDWSRQGKTNLFLYESKEFYTDGNFEGGLKFGVAKQDGTLEVALFARNITDEVNVKGGIDFNNNTAFVNEPRIIGVSLSARLP